MSKGHEEPPKERWRRSPELPPDVFAAWKKAGGELNPSSVVATIDEGGAPRVAPFGSMRAVNPRLLRFIAHRYHDSLANLKRESRIMVAMICAPDIAVSVRGRARVVEEPFSLDQNYALVEVDVDEVKNDMPVRIGIDTGISISPSGPFVAWWNNLWERMEKE
ncbi:MAG: pyridoxamine 5'-phosphate oxidase family protein [Candidatus Thorarchaeota archaeon]